MNNEYFDYVTQNEKFINYNIIRRNNEIIISELKKQYNDIDDITIIGKGVTATYIPDAIGVNQAMLFTNKKFLFFNDFESMFGIEHLLQYVEYIFCPDYPHCNQIVKDNYYKSLNYAKQFGFNGKVFIYRIASSKSNELLKYTMTTSTTTHIIIDFFNKFLGIKNFKFYGVAISTSYHNDILNLNFNLSRHHDSFQTYYNSINTKDKIEKLKKNDISHNAFRNSMNKKIVLQEIDSVTFY